MQGERTASNDRQIYGFYLPQQERASYVRCGIFYRFFAHGQEVQQAPQRETAENLAAYAETYLLHKHGKPEHAAESFAVHHGAYGCNDYARILCTWIGGIR